MKDFLIFLIKLFVYAVLVFTIWFIIKFPIYVSVLFLNLFVLLLIAHLIRDKELEILILISSVFLAGSIILLHNYQAYNVWIDKILIIFETVFIIFVFLFLQKKSWEIEVYDTSFVEQIENLQDAISTITNNTKELHTKILNINEMMDNFRIVESIITSLSTVSSISMAKNYAINLIHKVIPGCYVSLYTDESEVSENSIEKEVINYIKINNKYLFVKDINSQESKSIIKKHNIASSKDFKFTSIIGFPLKIYGSTLNNGYLILFSPEEISEDSLRLLSIFSSYLEISLSNLKLIEHTQNLAITDTLTGLYVHKYFKEILEEEINRVKYHNRIISLAMFDIDNFKQINDTYGHHIGDMVLTRFAEILRKRLREVDKICRYGGDEFTVIFPDTKLSDAAKISEELRNIVLNEAIVVPKSTSNEISSLVRVKFSISGGVIEYRPEYNYSVEEFINEVDKLLYKSKTEGKNRITVWQKV